MKSLRSMCPKYRGKIKVTTVVGVLILMSASLVAGYFIGHSPRCMILLPVSYVNDVGLDCLYIKRLKENETNEVLHNLKMNLNQQIMSLDDIWQHGESKWARESAYRLLLDIAQHRRDYELAPRKSKEGMTVHRILDDVETAAKEKPR